MKINKILIIGSFILILAIILGYFLMPKTSAEYKSILSEVERGNNYMINNNSGDDCFPYRYFHRGCYYGGKFKFYEGNLVSSFSYTNLTHKEKIDLCYKFAFKGSTAWCLHENAEDEKCLKFVKDNEYLKRICSLKEGEIIPEEIPPKSYFDLNE